MFKYISHSVWFGTKSCLTLLATVLLMAQNLSAWADTSQLNPIEELTRLPNVVTTELSGNSSVTIEETLQNDPLGSQYPVPWNWVMTTHSEMTASGITGIRYYRSPSLVSPDGQYAAYTRIQLQVQPELYESRVSSVMFLENLKTGELRTITASSPLADHPFSTNEEADMPGTISILIPVSWSQSGDRLLARQFEGLFNTSDASDYAVIWDRQLNQTTTVKPNNAQYETAILLGWSHNNPDQVLFKAGELGEEKWPLYAVNLDGQTVAVNEEEPQIFGQIVKNVWAGPQTYW